MKKILLPFLAVVYSLTVSAQTDLNSPLMNYYFMKNVSKQSNFIFEGKMTERFFYEESPGNVYTAFTIQITTIFKGGNQLQCGEVLFIQQGSSGEVVNFNGREYWTDGSDGHTIEFREGAQGIFFTVENNMRYPEPNSNPTNNTIIIHNVSEGSGSFINYKYDPRYLDTLSLNTINNFAEGFGGLNFDDIVQVEDFFRDSIGMDTLDFVDCGWMPPASKTKSQEKSIENWHPILIKPEKKLNKEIEIETVPDKEELYPHTNPTIHQKQVSKKRKKKVQDFENSLNERIRNNPPIKLASRAGEDLTYSFKNEEYTGTATRYFEFDIYARTNQANVYVDNCPIHLSYASSAFGDSVISNNKITVTPAVAFNTSTYADPNVLSTDWDKNTVALVMGLDYQQTSYNRVLLPQTDIKLMHVKMEIKQCYQPSDMFMINYLTVKNVCFFTKNATEPTTGNFYIYNDVIFNNHNNYVLCQPIITSFNNNLRAGVDMLIINGKHFGQGSVSGNYGKILFMDANAPNLGYSSYIQNLDDYDLVSWNDKQIKIRLSSRIIRSGQRDRTMGSGKFIIKTNIGDSVYSDSLNVKYAITQSPQIPSQNNKKI